ncbi:MAG: methyltransferase domain-containing protein, partial [Bacteroidota bacterium]
MTENRKRTSGEDRLKGTYVLSSLEEKEIELERLQKQAGAMPVQELAFMKRHGLKPGMHVLDAACGPGITAGLIHDFVVPQGGTVTGIDQDESLLRIANGLASNHAKQINFVKGDVYDLPFGERFDYIYCRFLFQHLAHPAKALQSMFKALKPGGIINILDVNDEWLFLEPSIPAFEELCELARHHQSKLGGNRLIGKELRSLLLNAGLQDPVTDVLMVNSDILGLRTFLELTTFFKREIIVQGGEDPKELIDAIKKIPQAPNISFSLQLFLIAS